MDAFIAALGESLREDRSSENLRNWSHRVVEEEIPIVELASLLDAEGKVPLRLTWLLGGLVERRPELLFPALPLLFSRREDMTFPGYHRSLGKWMYFAGIPEEIEGEAIDALFTWAADLKENISTTRFALLALIRASKKHPDLRSEIRLIIESQLDQYTSNFKKQLQKMLLDLT